MFRIHFTAKKNIEILWSWWGSNSVSSAIKKSYLFKRLNKHHCACLLAHDLQIFSQNQWCPYYSQVKVTVESDFHKYNKLRKRKPSTDQTKSMHGIVLTNLHGSAGATFASKAKNRGLLDPFYYERPLYKFGRYAKFLNL